MLSHYDNDPTQEKVIPRRSSARRRDPLSQEGYTFRPDVSDAQTFAFAKLTNCLIFEDFSDNNALLVGSIFGGAFGKLPICSHVNMISYR